MDGKINILSFRDLKVWQRGMDLAKQVYCLTSELPKSEIFGLISQMRRAAISIPSNIAEGRSRSTKKDFCQFLRIALGSLAELETQTILARDLYKELKIDTLLADINEEQKMIAGLLKKLSLPNT